MKKSIKEWAIDERPREKLLQHGSALLSKAELVGILIGSGTKEESAVGVAQKILDSVGHNLSELGKLTINDLCKFKGIGEARAIAIVTALELGKRRLKEEVQERAKIQSSKDSFELIYPYLAGLREEQFWVILLNQGLNVLQIDCISKGGITQTTVDTRVLFRKALEQNATSLLVVHNHPSGNLTPSLEDKRITKNIKEAGQLLNINLLDHLIVYENQYFSFADEGIL